jgi:hypothetical protein
MYTLQGKNGQEFVNEIIQNWAEMFDAKIIHGKLQTLQNHGSIQHANQEFETFLFRGW